MIFDGKRKAYQLDDLECGATPNALVPLVPTAPKLWGIPLKYLSLITLAVQNSALAILMHSARLPQEDGASETYSAATAVLMSEILKGLISLAIALIRLDSSGISTTETTPSSLLSPQRHSAVRAPRARKLWQEVFSSDCWKLSIPAILYVLQNNLQYSAASNLPAATFQVTYQMKILTTAIFSVVLLRKKLSSTQWFSLFCLAVGVAIVQIQARVQAHPTHVIGTAHSMNPLVGFSAVTAACFTSGLAGVYFEMVLKGSKTDLWIRNVQLSFFSILPALAPILVDHRMGFHATLSNGHGGTRFLASLFHNFTPTAWATIAAQVLGGLVTAMVIKYSDNIMKGFATSLSIIISFVASILLFQFRVSGTFMLGSSIVLAATYMYNAPAMPILLTTPPETSLEKTLQGVQIPTPSFEELKDGFEDLPDLRQSTFSSGSATSLPSINPTSLHTHIHPRSTEHGPERHLSPALNVRSHSSLRTPVLQ